MEKAIKLTMLSHGGIRWPLEPSKPHQLKTNYLWLRGSSQEMRLSTKDSLKMRNKSVRYKLKRKTICITT